MKSLVIRLLLASGLVSLLQAVSCPSDWASFPWSTNPAYACFLNGSVTLPNATTLNLHGASVTCGFYTILVQSNVSMSNLTLTGARNGSLSAAGNLSLDQVAFLGCQAQANGGAIRSFGFVILRRCIFKSCYAQEGFFS